MHIEYPSKLLGDAVQQLSKLPGIGSKTALRLVLHMLKWKKEEALELGTAMNRLVEEIKHCHMCKNISDNDICEICADDLRDAQTICVVENINNVMAIEHTKQFKGVYHVLGGIISPIDGIGPNNLEIPSLIARIEKKKPNEIILALSTTMEGDTTNFYLFKKLQPYNIKISSLARGISIGDELEHIDELTLGRSIRNRIDYEATLNNQ